MQARAAAGLSAKHASYITWVYQNMAREQGKKYTLAKRIRIWAIIWYFCRVGFPSILFYDFDDSNRTFKRDCTVYTGY